MTSYRWQPLPDPREWIRVLRLSPGTGNDSLKASLEVFRIKDDPEYEAISYFWGPDQSTKKLSLQSNGQEHVVLITKNLDRALRTMRDDSKVRVLWTDAICINQEDEEEKSHQVRMMGQIYASATKVLVYLGEPGDSFHFEDAKKLIRRIHDNSDRPLPEQGGMRQWLKDCKLPLVEENWKWEPLKSFFRRPWFRRKWTIQECALASNLEFHCGEWKRSWDYMNRILATIYNKGLAVTDYTTYAIVSEETRQLQQGISQINSVRLYRQEPPDDRGHGFQQLAYRFQTSDAKDKRDHLFALLGMATDTGDKQLDPKYGESTELENSVRYARFFLHRDQSLEVLYRAGLTGHELLAPSWVPNWYGNHCSFGFEPSQGVWDPSSRPDHLNVARGTNISLVSTNNSAVLGLKGVIIDSIKELANEHLHTIHEIARDKQLVIDFQRNHLMAADKIMKQVGSYRTGETAEDVLWRTLVCNTTLNRTIPGDDVKQSYEAWRRATLIMATTQGGLDANFSGMQIFSKIYGGCNADKTFGLTNEGFVGMFPHQAKRGDVIAVLRGGEFPFVLRRCTAPCIGDYELVGQCYVHGIMEEGQFDLRKWESREEEILLGGIFSIPIVSTAIWKIVLVAALLFLFLFELYDDV